MAVLNDATADAYRVAGGDTLLHAIEYVVGQELADRLRTVAAYQCIPVRQAVADALTEYVEGREMQAIAELDAVPDSEWLAMAGKTQRMSDAEARSLYERIKRDCPGLQLSLFTAKDLETGGWVGNVRVLNFAGFPTFRTVADYEAWLDSFKAQP